MHPAADPITSKALERAAAAVAAGDLAAAHRYVEAALARDPDDAAALHARAQLQERAGDRPAAIASWERAVALRPDFAAALHRLGIVLGESGAHERALSAFQRVIALEPANARAHNNLGNALRTLDRNDEALAAFERAVALKPDYDLAIANLATGWRDAGNAPRAERLLRAALARKSEKPPLRALVVLLAGLLRERDQLEEAEALYVRAIAMAPDQAAGEWFNLGRLHAERDDLAEAGTAYRRSIALDPTDLRGVLAERLSLPMVYASAAHVDEARAAYANAVETLNDGAEGLVGRLNGDQVIDGLRWTNFLLAYQGRDDRDLQQRYADFTTRAIELRAPQWRAPLARRSQGSAKIRVGFASAFFHVGTAGRYFRSWITDLDRERFEVFVYHLHPGMDEVAADIRARADRFVEFGGRRARPSAVAPVVKGDALDILVYPELGMDHGTFALAALRLAPRQLAGWGHPVTTGFSTIDGFVTCSAMEPADARDHYAETLLKLPGVGTRYRSLAVPPAVSRAQLGLPEDRPLFLCPQSLFKVHPDNDALFAAVLAANPDAALVMFDGRQPRVTERFVARLHAALEQHGVSHERQLIVRPALPHADYLRVNLACDAMLDTLHWSGGNTSLDALACGLPIVTLEGAYMRGRQSAAMLRMCGVSELIASDQGGYVEQASRLARDGAWRADLSRRIAAGRGAIFDDPAPVAAFARLLVDLR